MKHAKTKTMAMAAFGEEKISAHKRAKKDAKVAGCEEDATKDTAIIGT